MADNPTIDNGALTDYVVSTDEGAGGHVQRVKLAYSADGSEVHVPADADGLLVNLGANNDVTVSGVSTAANQATIITHVDGIETVLGTIDTDTGSIATSTATLAGAVSGTEMQVDVLTMPTVTVTGTVTANAGSGTLAVSAASLPLPSGASTAAKQPALGTAGTASTDVITVQGIASGTVIPVSDGGGALTVDGTVAATQSGTWNVTNVSGTVSLPTGASTAANQSTIIGHVDGIETLLGTIDADTSVLAANVVAHDAVDSGGSVKIGSKASSTTPTAVTAGDRVDLWLNPVGALVISAAGAVADAATSLGGFTNAAGTGVLPLAVGATVWDGTNQVRMRGDTTNGLDVDVTRSALPTGASTSALQTSSEALLTTIDADTGAMVTDLAAIEVLLGTIDTDTSVIAGDTTEIAAAVVITDAVASGSAPGIPPMFIRDDALSAITPAEGDWAPGRVDANGAQWVSISSGSVTASGTITAELSAVDNAVLDTIDAVLDTIKTDTTAISTAVGPVTPGTRVSLIDVDESEDEIKATAGTLYSLVVTNLASSTRYVRMYNATAASTTVGTTTPWRGPYAIPAGAGIVYVFERGLTFGTALCIAATTGVADSDTGAPGANEIVAEVVYT